MAQDSSIIFVTGGVRSGKSRFAERMAIDLWDSSKQGILHYIAPMKASDGEMVYRIERHQEDRVNSGYKWNTWEKEVSIGELSSHFNDQDIILLDCLTTWLNNELFYVEDQWQDATFRLGLLEGMWSGIQAINKKVKALIIVSNEVLYEPINRSELVFIYSQLLGNLHQRIVKGANQAYLVEAGIPMVMKGEG